MLSPESARLLLAGIRMVNGAAGLIAPGALARRAGADPSSATTYAFRMFGIRTVMIGADLLSGDRAVREHAARAALPIHLSDALTAATLTARGRISPRPGLLLTGISSFNVALALMLRRRA